MTAKAPLSTEAREDIIRRAWYSHDARWFAAVADEFGLDAANRLNRRIVRTIGQAEAGRLAKALGVEAALDLGEFLEFLEAGCRLYVAPPLIEMDVSQVDEHSYEVAVTRCFVAQNIQRAGIAGGYQCAVFDRVQGWHDALGLPLVADELPAARCPVAEGGGECRRVLAIQQAGPP